MKRNSYLKLHGLLPGNKSLLLVGLILILLTPSYSQRLLENLGRGIVAIRTGTNSAFISWRLLGNEPQDIGFNIYRSIQGGEAVKLNSSVLTKGTNFTDNSADFTRANAYFVKPVINNVEQEASKPYILAANEKIQPCLVVPLKPGDFIHFVWVGDLDGDGEYDFVVDRLGNGCKAEGYLRDGTYLWTIDMGPNSLNMNGISPGSSAIDVGHWDGLTVYDMDGDGKAEILLRTANGVKFGDGKVLTHTNNNIQFVSVIDGMTGAERARAQIPNDYLSVGPMACQMGIGYLNGVTPSLITFMKNRNPDKSFNRTACAWDFDGQRVALKWKTNMLFGTSYGSGSDGHQMRIGDFDGDGKDEVGQIGFVLNGNDGSLKYDLGKYGIGHGDRWFVGKLDPNRPGLQGYGIQQYNSIKDYYYDAGTGEVLWMHKTSDGSITDVGRGSLGDIDPNHPGYEVWEFSGLYNGPSNTYIGPNYPYPNFRIWWDGDVMSENLNDEKLEKHNGGRLLTLWHYEGGTGSARGAPQFYGDIIGDWREEVVLTNPTNDRLIIFTTPIHTEHRLYTLPHNPLYRNSMTIKGYMQSHMVDYYLGHGMQTPPKPNIQIVGTKLDCTGIPNGTAFLDSCGVCVGGTTGKNPCADIPEGYYIIKPASSGLCIQPSDLVTQQNCSGEADQVWKVTKAENYFKITSAVGSRFLTASTKNQGNQVSLGNAEDLIRLEKAENGAFTIVNSSNTDLVFDVSNRSIVAGAPILLWTRNRQDNQQFIFTLSPIEEDCNGNFGGTAFVDDCGRCAGGNSGKNACTGLLEAENSCRFDGTIEVRHEGYKGTGYVDAPFDINGSITFAIMSDISQDAVISIRYANGSSSGDRPASLTKDSSEQTINFVNTGAWTTWSFIDLPVKLNQGNNLFVLKASVDAGLPNIDQIAFITEGLSEGACIVTGTAGLIAEENGILVSPNPTTSVFTIRLNEEREVSISDIHGRVIEYLGKIKQARFGEEYKTGIYFVHIMSETETKVIKVIRK